MQPISGLAPGTGQSPIVVSGTKEVSKVQRPESEAQSRPLEPVMDKYIPEENQEPSGRYWLGKDEDGKPKIYFDAPEQTADDPERSEDTDNPDKKVSGDKAESCTCNTDSVDREIEKLKKKQAELEQQINSETDASKINALEKKLAQIESELSQKDNDTYRRQHSTFS